MISGLFLWFINGVVARKYLYGYLYTPKLFSRCFQNTPKVLPRRIQ